MPNLEDLDRFKRIVNSLGNEPAILEERGESLEYIPRPEEGLSDELSDLLGDTGGIEPEETDEIDDLLKDFGDMEEPEAEEEAAGEEEPFDLSDLGEPEESEAPEEAGEAVPEAAEEDEFDLDALIEETKPVDEEPAPEEADLSLGDEDLEIDIDSDIEDLAGPPPPAEAEGPEEEEEEPEEFGLEGMETPIEDIEEEPEAEEPEGFPEDADDLDTFDLDQFDFEGEEPEAEEEPGYETPETGFEEPEPEEESLFEVPEPEEEFEEEEFEPPEAEVSEIEEELPEDEFDLGGLEEAVDFEEEAPEVPEEAEEFEAEPEGYEDETPEPDFTAMPEIEDEFGIDFDLEEEGGEEEGGEEEAFEDTEEEEFEVPAAEEEDFEGMEMPEVDFESVPPAEGFEIEGEEGADEEDFAVDQFDLGDISEEFSLEEGMEFETPPVEEAEEEIGEFEEAEERFEVTDSEFDNMRRTLGTLPLNLKMIIEELIAEKDLSGPELKRLLDLLAAGAPAKAIAQAASKITGKKITIPERYERKTGAEFEEEAESFGYIFRTKVLPYLKIALALMVVLGFIGFLSYRFIFRPLRANSIYNEGYEDIRQDEYAEAKEQFDTAYGIWPKKEWFYKYADRYIEERQYYMAAEMYDMLLDYHPGDTRGLLDYAAMESGILSNFAGAEGKLKQILERDMYHYEALIAQGDNYLRWAEEEPSMYEPARRSYAMLMQEYGATDELLFRMMRYFIRTDKFREIISLKDQFQANPRAEINPHVYAELGGYLISKNVFSEVNDILFRALEVDQTIPEIHYHLARYYEGLEDYAEMDKALSNALRYLQGISPLTTKRLGMLIDTHNRIGRSHYRDEEYIQAEQSYQTGIELYEDAKERRLLGPAPQYGSLYANLGDIYYYVSGNISTAYELYSKAEADLYSIPSIRYKKGFILYDRGDFRSSLIEFYKAAGEFSTDKNLMFATANNLYMLGEYFAAQGYYNHLLDRLEQELNSIPFLMIDEREDHRSLVEYFEKVYNNLGVTLNQLDNKSADPTKFSRSLAYLARSTEYWDMLTRDPESLERSSSQSRAFLNTRSIIYPAGGQQLQIYPNIPLDFEDLRF